MKANIHRLKLSVIYYRVFEENLKSTYKKSSVHSRCTLHVPLVQTNLPVNPIKVQNDFMYCAVAIWLPVWIIA